MFALHHVAVINVHPFYINAKIIVASDDPCAMFVLDTTCYGSIQNDQVSFTLWCNGTLGIGFGLYSIFLYHLFLIHGMG